MNTAPAVLSDTNGLTEVQVDTLDPGTEGAAVLHAVCAAECPYAPLTADAVGAANRILTGARVGEAVVGALVGGVGAMEGVLDGTLEGTDVVGILDGVLDGTFEGAKVGGVGAKVGVLEGAAVGANPTRMTVCPVLEVTAFHLPATIVDLSPLILVHAPNVEYCPATALARLSYFLTNVYVPVTSW